MSGLMTKKHTKIFNGIKNKNDWSAFNWTVIIKGVECDYSMGLGHHKVSNKKPSGYIINNLTADESNKITNKRLGFYDRIFIKVPKIRDVIYSLAMDASLAQESFEDFCSNLGLDTDSRKALDSYLACQESGHKLRRMNYDINRILEWEL